MNTFLFLCSITYILLGFVYLLMIPTPEWYVMLSIYLLFKWIFNYRKCTLSYYEILLRNVNIRQGYLYQFLESVIDLRDNPYIISIYSLQTAIISRYFFEKIN